jgi:hypothetical protein
MAWRRTIVPRTPEARHFLLLEVAVAVLMIMVVGVFYVVTRYVPASIPNDWRSGTVEGGGTFRYTPEAGGAYVSMQDWPPTVSARVGTIACERSDMHPFTETYTFSVDGNDGCMSITREGAAGSTYASYVYATQRDTRVVTIAFTVRMPQCMHYDEPARGDCTAAQAAFDADSLVVDIVRTIAW